MATYTHTLGKQERLKSRKKIDLIFQDGKSKYTYPIKMAYLIEERPIASKFPLKFTVSVPKKLYKRAVDRNLLKRRIRESYRIQKSELNAFLKESNLSLALMMIYIGKEILDYPVIDKSITKLITKLEYEVGHIHNKSD